MKKIIYFLLFFILIFNICSSCNKVETTDSFSEIATVTFNVNTLEGVSFTKGIETSSDVISAIRLTFPTYYYLRLVNIKNGNKYEVISTDNSRIPNGTYRVVNYARDDSRFENVGKGSCNPCGDEISRYYTTSSLCKFPWINIDETIEINGDGIVDLTGVIVCQAFVYDNTLIDNVVSWPMYSGSDYEWKIRCVNNFDNFSFFFCKPTPNSNGWSFLHLKCIPKENLDLETTTYYININPSNDGLPFANYYILKCSETPNSDVLGNVNINDFSVGDDLSNYIEG